MKNQQLEELVRRLSETECAIEALTDGQVDAVVDPASGLPILLREAQAKLRRAYEDLEEIVRERTAELVQVNERLQAEVAERQRLLDEARLERQRAERAAHLAEDMTCLTESLIEMMPVGVLISDAGGTLLSTNTAGREILGAPVYGHMEKPIRSYSTFYPDGRPYDFKDLPLRRSLQSGERVTNVQYLVRLPDGEEKMLLVSTGAARNSSGEIVRGMVVFQDITERQRIEDALSTEQARLKAIIENAPEGIMVTDAQGRIVLHNPAAQAIYHWPVPIGRPLGSEANLVLCYANGGLYLPEDLPLTRSALHGETTTGLEMDILWPDGRRRNLLINTAPIRGEDGELQGAVAIFQDITERRRTEVELDMERARLRAVFDHAPEGIVVTDTQARILLSNRTAEALYQRPVPVGQEVESHASLQLYYPDGGPYRPEDLPLTRSACRGEIFIGARLDVIWPDGQRRILLVNTAPIRGENDELQGAIGIFQDITERQRMEDELETERARFKAIIENAPEGIVVTDAQGKVILHNHAAQAIYEGLLSPGLQNEEKSSTLMAYPDGGFYAPADLPLTRSALRGETISGLEVDIVWPDGQRRNVLASTAPFRDDEGNIQGAVGIYQDITERKRSRRALIEYAERLKVLRQTDQAILSIDPMEDILGSMLRFLHKLLDCVRASVVLFDFERQEMSVLAVYTPGVTKLNKDWHGPMQAVGPDWATMLDALHHGDVWSVDDLGHTPADMVKSLHAEGVQAKVYVPLIIEDRLIGSLNLGLGTPGRLASEQIEIAKEFADQIGVAIQQDRLRQQVQQHAHYLEEKVAQRTIALQNSMAQFQAIFESAAIGIAVLDEEGHVLNSNPALRRILGYPAEELQGKRLFDLVVSADEAHDARRLYENMIAGQLNYFRSEITYRRQDGQPVVASRTMSLVRNAQGTPVRAIAMIEDIGEQKKAQKALIQSEKLVLMGRMSASFAHEINNPLQSVIGCLGLADEMLEDGSKISSYLQIAMEELERAAGIVHQLRDLGRSPKSFEKVPVDINALLENILLLMHKRFEKEKVQLDWVPAKGLPPVRIARDRMHQVFLNLFLNALEAMPEGGELHIGTVFTPPAGIRITVSDNGVGITADKLEHIFEPFHSNRPDGLGLGLYVSKSIVDEHEGNIQVESTPGKGTTFTIWLPR